MPFLLFNKPFGIVTQFSGDSSNLSNHINIKSIYPAGRLDKKSEGLILLTNDGKLQARISEPRNKLEKHYWVQVEGLVKKKNLDKLINGINLNDGFADAVDAFEIKIPSSLWQRDPEIRYRKNTPTSWMNIIITEGRNHQIRRMTANVGIPTLRLIRHKIGPWSIDNIGIGEYRQLSNKDAWNALNSGIN
tara:strand:- start:556 stop:1125 length:570 start_codon:yes stop_codon:yes gene_type:complete